MPFLFSVFVQNANGNGSVGCFSAIPRHWHLFVFAAGVAESKCLFPKMPLLFVLITVEKTKTRRETYEDVFSFFLSLFFFLIKKEIQPHEGPPTWMTEDKGGCGDGEILTWMGGPTISLIKLSEPF